MRIKQIEVSSFRGIPNTLSISLPIKNNKPVSLIILGDNGVGKSSIVDAIEICLQANRSKGKSFNIKTEPSLRSYFSNKLPEIKITLENNEIVNRKIIEDEQGLLFDKRHPHNLFSISPFVLRRHDILRFIDSSEAERTLVFSNYLRSSVKAEWKVLPKDELKRLQDERLSLKIERDNKLEELAKELNVDVIDIPLERKQYEEFVNYSIYKGFSKKPNELKVFKIKINKKALALSEEALILLDGYRKIKDKINSYSVLSDKSNFPKHLIEQFDDFIGKVGDKLTKSFLEISNLNFIEKVEIKYDNQNVLALSLIFILKNNSCCTPNQILSEANLDLLALLLYLSFIVESTERGQSKFLILDDVLQSVDAAIRVNFITYLLKNYSDWQYVITAHDRLWHRQLIEIMNLHGHQHTSITIVDWTFENGPIIKIASNSIEDSLKSAIQNNDLVSICSNSGLLMEQICDGISKSLNTVIQRKRDDKYTLGDLWPGISKILKKTTKKEKIESVEKWLHLRNLIGAHYNEWALSLSLDEAKAFGYSVLEFFECVKCVKCSNWIINNSELNFYTCKCGDVTIQKK